jgi:hypothetical protein
VPKPLNLIGVCTLCKRRHDNLGYSPTQRHPIKWLCWRCLPFAKWIYKMKTQQLDVYEMDAIFDGGEKAGQYLDQIGQTDLAKLSEDQFCEMFARFMEGFEVSMRGKMEAVRDTL